MLKTSAAPWRMTSLMASSVRVPLLSGMAPTIRALHVCAGMFQAWQRYVQTDVGLYGLECFRGRRSCPIFVYFVSMYGLCCVQGKGFATMMHSKDGGLDREPWGHHPWKLGALVATSRRRTNSKEST